MEEKNLGSYDPEGTANAVSVPSTGLHTPGPWYWRDVEGMRTLAPGVLILGDGIGCGGPWGDEIDRQNARLIAAAPELLDALTSILYEDSDKSEADRLLDRVKAAAAIDKATGGCPHDQPSFPQSTPHYRGG